MEREACGMFSVYIRRTWLGKCCFFARGRLRHKKIPLRVQIKEVWEEEREREKIFLFFAGCDDLR